MYLATIKGTETRHNNNDIITPNMCLFFLSALSYFGRYIMKICFSVLLDVLAVFQNQLSVFIYHDVVWLLCLFMLFCFIAFVSLYLFKRLFSVNDFSIYFFKYMYMISNFPGDYSKFFKSNFPSPFFFFFCVCLVFKS